MLFRSPVAVQERRSNYKNYTDYTGIAAIYYLATPDGIPESNDTQYWAPESDKSELFGNINTNGAEWQKVDNKDKNIRENVNNHVSTWPDGTAGSSWIDRKSACRERV